MALYPEKTGRTKSAPLLQKRTRCGRKRKPEPFEFPRFAASCEWTRRNNKFIANRKVVFRWLRWKLQQMKHAFSERRCQPIRDWGYGCAAFRRAISIGMHYTDNRQSVQNFNELR